MLEVRNISFAWGRKQLLEDVSFTIAPGEVAVLAGANGAGKTSLMKVLAGLCMPSGGTVAADGVDIFANPLRYRRMMGYLPESAPADPDMTVREGHELSHQVRDLLVNSDLNIVDVVVHLEPPSPSRSKSASNKAADQPDLPFRS